MDVRKMRNELLGKRLVAALESRNMVAPWPGGTEQPRIQAGAAGGRGHAAGECTEKPLCHGAFLL